jgi:HD-GYP domain-containing protein (c-di-GMP phosphodiesterase class II)
LLHDIGKIGVSDDILGKKESLDDSDWKPIHSHPEMGVSILRHVDSIKECLLGVLCHHERYDGTGYPQGLKGENIPLDARIFNVVERCYDSSRLYHENPHTSGWAIEELIRSGLNLILRL